MYRIIGVLCCIVLCLGSYSIVAQQNDFIFHHLRLQDGLSQAENAFVYKDTRGFVWIGSINGLNRFDGIHTKVYTPDITDPSSILGENIQSQFFEDSLNNIWFCTYDAINKYNWDHDCFDHYQVLDSLREGRIGYYLFYLDPTQHLWLVLENQYLYTFHIPTGTFQYKGEIKSNTIRTAVVTNSSGHISRILCLGRNWPGIHVVDVNNRHEIDRQYVLSYSSVLHVNNIPKVVVESESIIWILAPSALVRYSFVTKEERIRPLQDGEDMIILSDSILLIGTASRGLLSFHAGNWDFVSHQYRVPNLQRGLQSNSVHYLTKDRDENLWVSTVGVGVSYAHPHKKKFSTILLSNHIQADKEIIPVQIIEDKPGRVLYFTEGDGILEITPKGKALAIQQETIISPKVPTAVHNVIRDFKGRYWISTWSGLYVYYPQLEKAFQATDSTLIGFTSYALPNGRMLFTTTQPGLFEGFADNEGHCHLSLIPEVPLGNEYYPVMLDNKGRIWLNDDLQRFIVLDSSNYQVIDSIPVNGSCKAMISSRDSATIWIASSSGLYEIDESTLSIRNIHSDDTGLPAFGINNMLMDENGILWLTHYSGILAFNPVTGHVRSYTEEDGLPSAEFAQATCKLENGEFWFASVGGLTRFFPDSVKDIQIKAIPQITELLVNDKIPEVTPVCEITGATHITEIQKLRFSFKNNGLSFVVNALEYSAPKFNKVLYQMKGLDAQPIEVASGSRVRYPDLQPGTYTFVLYALNSDGIANPQPRELIIVIRPPFYRTLWFIILVVVFIISIIAYIIYLRFSKKLELQKVRLKLYENLHDDVGSRLTAIVLSAEDLERNEDISHPKLTNISKIARSIVGNMRRLVWAIDPENDRMNSILQKINHDKSQVLDDKIDFRIEIDNHLKNIIVPGEIRYQMSSICNEAFNNISKYAQASKVWVKVTREDKFLKMVVEDNGKGFDPQEKSKNALTGSGYGLANMQRRASRVGGKLIIHSRPGEGTRVEFTFPFK